MIAAEAVSLHSTGTDIPEAGLSVEGVTVIGTVGAFAAALEAARWRGATIGLVPTMGSLHAGHAALISRARAECDLVAVTVFVNPTQFDDPADLAAYPRNADRDVAQAASAGAGIVFVPPVEEMYQQASATVVSVPSLSGIFEGASRVGHFDGVATVVTKLFAMAGRCRAYFGVKDYQQLLVVRRMACDLCFPVEVIGCPIVRDEDGLALSSRNARLSTDERRAALVLHRALLEGRRAIDEGERSPSTVESIISAVIAEEPLACLDYAAAVDASDLASPATLSGEVRLLVAARVGGVRLIDNLSALIPPPAPSRHRLDDERHLQ